jgi:hypothetical protein
MDYSRRQFSKIALGGLPLVSGIILPERLFAQSRPNSKIAGVQIGVMVPNSLRGVPDDLTAYRDAMLKIGLSACETHEGPFETFAGAPQPPPRGAGRGAPSPEQAAAQKIYADALTKWRTSIPMSKFAEGRKIWNDAGIQPYAFKMPITLEMSDAEADYAFNIAKTLGVNHYTMEMPDDPLLSRRMGELGRKHNMKVGYHAHGEAKPDYWDLAMSQSPYNCINLDVGHYVGAGNADAVDFVKKNHARIVSMHLKDRKLGGPNMPWGQGDTPLMEILHLVRDQKWGFPVTIELEYPIPTDSTMVDEVAKCYAYVKSALTS